MSKYADIEVKPRWVEQTEPDVLHHKFNFTESSIGSVYWGRIQDADNRIDNSPSVMVPWSQGTSSYSTVLLSVLEQFTRPRTLIDADDISGPEPHWITVDVEIVGDIGYEHLEFSQDDF